MPSGQMRKFLVSAETTCSAYGTGELPAMIASSRDYHAYRSQGHVPGDLIPIANTNHFTILDELRQPNSTLTRAVVAMAQYQDA